MFTQVKNFAKTKYSMANKALSGHFMSPKMLTDKSKLEKTFNELTNSCTISISNTAETGPISPPSVSKALNIAAVQCTASSINTVETQLVASPKMSENVTINTCSAGDVKGTNTSSTVTVSSPVISKYNTSSSNYLKTEVISSDSHRLQSNVSICKPKLLMANANLPARSKPPVNTVHSSRSQRMDPMRSCIFCAASDHNSHGCRRYASCEGFWAQVYENRLCKNCLRPYHKAEVCYNKSTCLVNGCSRPDKHSTVLCRRRYSGLYFHDQKQLVPKLMSIKTHFLQPPRCEVRCAKGLSYPKNHTKKNVFSQGTQTAVDDHQSFQKAAITQNSVCTQTDMSWCSRPATSCDTQDISKYTTSDQTSAPTTTPLPFRRFRNDPMTWKLNLLPTIYENVNLVLPLELSPVSHNKSLPPVITSSNTNYPNNVTATPISESAILQPPTGPISPTLSDCGLATQTLYAESSCITDPIPDKVALSLYNFLKDGAVNSSMDSGLAPHITLSADGSIVSNPYSSVISNELALSVLSFLKYTKLSQQELKTQYPDLYNTGLLSIKYVSLPAI